MKCTIYSERASTLTNIRSIKSWPGWTITKIFKRTSWKVIGTQTLYKANSSGHNSHVLVTQNTLKYLNYFSKRLNDA